MRGDNAVTRHRIRPHPELLGLRQAGPGSQQSAGKDRQTYDGDGCNRGGTTGHPFGDPMPGAGIEGGTAVRLGYEGPKQSSAA